MAEFTIRRRIQAPRERVWQEMLGLMAGANGEPEYEKLGNPAPHGPGAVKEINLFGYPMREETVALEPPCQRAYRLISGMPVDSYDGCMTLEAVEEATELEWTARMDAADAALAEDFAEKCRGVLERAIELITARSETDP
jgi:hypothetical protein